MHQIINQTTEQYFLCIFLIFFTNSYFNSLNSQQINERLIKHASNCIFCVLKFIISNEFYYERTYCAYI